MRDLTSDELQAANPAIAPPPLDPERMRALADQAPAAAIPSVDVEIFDPPLCCPTGLCGPVLDTTLVDLSEAIFTLEAEGHTVVRHMMTADPQAFMRNREVYQLIKERQLEVLPITVMGGRIVKTDAYPTLDELRIELTRID
jgi:hypothetical protein